MVFLKNTSILDPKEERVSVSSSVHVGTEVLRVKEEEEVCPWREEDVCCQQVPEWTETLTQIDPFPYFPD